MAKQVNISVPYTSLSVDILKRYLDGRLSAKERIEVEKQLKEDPLAADALEGLRALENHDLLLTIAPAMQRETRQMLARKRHRKFIGISIRQYVMAAAVIIVVWLSFSIFKEIGNNKSNNSVVITPTDTQNIAQIHIPAPTILTDTVTTFRQKEKEATLTSPTSIFAPVELPPPPPPPLASEQYAYKQEEINALEADKIKRVELEKKEESAKISDEPSVGFTKTPSLASTTPSSPKEDLAFPAKDIPIVANGATIPGADGIPSKPKATSPKKGGKTSPSPSAPRAESNTKAQYNDDYEAHIEQQSSNTAELQAEDVNMSAGVDDYNRGNYAKAAEAFKKIPAHSIFYAESRFMLGKSQAALQQYTQAISTFKNIGRKSPFHFQAQWELTQVYLAKGDKERAKKVLSQLSKENNPYQSQAQAKLVEIN